MRGMRQFGRAHRLARQRRLGRLLALLLVPGGGTGGAGAALAARWC